MSQELTEIQAFCQVFVAPVPSSTLSPLQTIVAAAVTLLNQAPVRRSAVVLDHYRRYGSDIHSLATRGLLAKQILRLGLDVSATRAQLSATQPSSRSSVTYEVSFDVCGRTVVDSFKDAES